MKSIQIEKEHFGIEEKGVADVRVGNGWISNGHWIIRIEYVLNFELFVNERATRAAFPFIDVYRELSEDAINSVIPRPGDQGKVYKWTPWIYEHDTPRNLRAFKAVAPGTFDEKVILFDDRYIKGFNIEKMLGNGDKEGTYVVLDSDVKGEPELMMALRTCHSTGIEFI